MSAALSEFLLARIAEDERVAALSVSHGIGGLPAAFGRGLYNGPGQHPVMTAQRLLAECEAKRAIIRHAAHAFYQAWQDGALRSVSEFNATMPLRLLAQIYADHPDYQPEWSPSDAHA